MLMGGLVMVDIREEGTVVLQPGDLKEGVSLLLW